MTAHRLPRAAPDAEPGRRAGSPTAAEPVEGLSSGAVVEPVEGLSAGAVVEPVEGPSSGAVASPAAVEPVEVLPAGVKASPAVGTPAPVRRARRGLGARIRGRAWDATAILVSWFGGLLLIGDAASFRHFSDEAMALFFALGCLFSLTLWWRRRHPTRVAVFLAVAALATDGAGIAALIAYYTVVSRRRGRDVVVATVVNLVGATAYLFLFPDPSVPWPFGLLLAVAFIASTLAAGMAARSRRELIESLRERAARAEEEARLRADRLRALERERIAREMHDALAHRISMVSLHAGALQIRPDLTPGEVARAATTIRDSAHHALEDLREILGVLRAGPGDALRPQPGLEHLGELVAEAERAGVRVDLRDRLGDRPVSGSLGRTVYRLVQEGLTNAGKHAGGALVTVLLDRAPDGALHVLVSNPLLPGPRAGSGRTEVPGAGSGLVGLAERVDLLDGRMRHGVRGDPRTGLTFDLEAWLPWPTPSGS